MSLKRKKRSRLTRMRPTLDIEMMNDFFPLCYILTVIWIYLVHSKRFELLIQFCLAIFYGISETACRRQYSRAVRKCRSLMKQDSCNMLLDRIATYANEKTPLGGVFLILFHLAKRRLLIARHSGQILLGLWRLDAGRISPPEHLKRLG